MNGVINLLANNGYIILNKIVIKKLGLHEAIILGELCSEYTHWEKNGKLEDNYFYSTRENIEENTGLSAYQQREPMKKLISLGVILEKSKGMPLQKWYSLNSKLLYKLLCEDLDLATSSEETKEQDVKKLNSNENKVFSSDLTTSCKEISQQDIKKLDDKILRNCSTSKERTKEHDVKNLHTNNNNINNKKNNKKNNNKYLYNSEQKVKFKDKVFLTKKQYNELIKKFGKEKIDNLITRMDLYKKSTGKIYEDDYATILLWINTSINKNKSDFTEDSEWMKNAKEKFGEDLQGLYANFSNF